MYNVNVTNARGDFYKLVDMAVSGIDAVNIVTKKGNAVMISEQDYNNYLETMYLSSEPQVKADILEGKNAKLEDCVSEEDIDW